MGKYYFAGYTLTFAALEQMSMARTGKTVSIFDGVGPYVRQMREALDSPKNTLQDNTFDSLFPVVRVIPMKQGSRDTEGIVLVRADGTDSRPGCLLETAGDKEVKAMMEACLDFELGPFQVYEEFV